MALQTLSKFEEIKNDLIKEIEKIKNQFPLSKNRILRFEVQIDAIDILNWLEAQSSDTKLYWSSREGDFEVGGVGLAYALHGTNVIDYDAINFELQKYLTSDNPNLKFFGGIAFNQKSVDKNWEPFGSYRFVLPRFEIFKKKNDTYFVCNIFGNTLTEERLDNIFEELNNIVFENSSLSKFLPKPNSRTDEPDDNRWMKELKGIITQLDADHLKKVVLARKSSFEFPVNINPILLLKRLKEISSECYHFCFQTNEASAFIGASPERLYKRIGKTFETEALAGTRPRGILPDEDKKFKDELLSSQKDRFEHGVVVDSLKAATKQICSKLEVDLSPTLLALKSGQHLLTSIRATLNKDTDDALILKVLHPTPAVGGDPTDKALKIISRFEAFKRGWYAGPIGYLGFNTAEFAVGIRSGLIANQKLFLYAGAGLVKGSNPKEEWNEIETKISSFLEIFTNGNQKSA